MSEVDLKGYLEQARELALSEIRSLIPRDEQARRSLYDLVLDYPLREAKGLRPALCIAACRALGGQLQAVAPSAAVLELYHNAFLIHDDIEDQSELRRGKPTLHLQHGVPIAVNVGDAMLALALQPLLDNTRLLGLGRSLRILQSVAHMVTLSVEGQALELDWIAACNWDVSDSDYCEMVVKKTGWYSFITPVLVGAIAAGAPSQGMARLADFARSLSVGFQIQDDILNLEQGRGEYGKEFAGDLWEGKRTLILLHALREATPEERWAAEVTLRKPRPLTALATKRAEGLAECIDRLVAEGQLSARGREVLQAAVLVGEPPQVKQPREVDQLLCLIQKYGSVHYARQCARRWVDQAAAALGEWSRPLEDSQHLRFLFGVLSYVVARTR
ncbi:MAG: polyprenyl synthetase family protein [Deltaproteobacteria bacterium]